MRKLWTISWKDALLRFSSRAEWLFFLILPIFFTLVLSGGTGAPADTRIRLIVVDQAGTSLSAELLEALSQSEVVRPEETDLAEAEDQFSERRVSAVLIIPPEYDLSRLAQGSVDLELRQQPNNMNALVASRAVSTVLSRVGSAVQIAQASVAEAERIRPFASDEQRQAYFEAALAEARREMSQAPKRVTSSEGTTVDSVEYDPRANSSAGQLITWVFIPLIGMSSLFASERQRGTLRRLLITPTRRATYLLGTILGQVALAVVQMLLLVGFGILVMNLNWGHAPAALAVMLLSSTLAAAALGITLGTFVETEGQATGLSIMMGMVMALLGGCWYPLELFPEFVQTAVRVLPTTWAMDGMLSIVLRGQGLEAVLLPAGVLLGFAALFFAVGVWRFRYE
jgi:ABC-2 type transport system permease protein